MEIPLVALFVLVSSFALVYFTIPEVIKLINFKGLVDTPNDRSSHTTNTPTLGGVSFFIALVFASFLSVAFDSSSFSIHLVCCITILCFLGIKDDLQAVRPSTKLLAQALCVYILLSSGSIDVTDLHGFLTVDRVDAMVSHFLVFMVVVAVINAYNLIDGIDGLASLVGIVCSVSFGFLMYLLGDYFLFSIAVSIVGCLSAFLIYNFSKRRKIFMGDTGSMIIGFVLSVFTIRLFSATDLELGNLSVLPENTWVLSASILFIPFFDSFRVFSLRLLKRKSPFSPDRNHVHHILIDFWGLSHKKTSLVLALVNIVVVIIFYFLSTAISCFWMSILFASLVISLLLVVFLLNKSFSSNRVRVVVRKKLDKKSQ